MRAVPAIVRVAKGRGGPICVRSSDQAKRVRTQRESQGITIAAVLKQKGAAIISVAPETGMADVAHVITAQRIGAVVVMDAARKLVGHPVLQRDVVKALSQRGAAVLDLKAADIMTRDVTMVDPTTPVDLAMEIMDSRLFLRHPPVFGTKDGEAGRHRQHP